MLILIQSFIFCLVLKKLFFKLFFLLATSFTLLKSELQYVFNMKKVTNSKQFIQLIYLKKLNLTPGFETRVRIQRV